MTTDQPDLTADRARPRSCPTCRSIGAPRRILSGTPGEVCQDQWHADPFAHLPLPERIEARAADIAAHAATIRARSEALDLALGRELPQSMLMGTLPDGPDRSGRLIGFEPMDDAGYPPESGGPADVPWLDHLAAASVRSAEAKFGPMGAAPCLFADEHTGWDATNPVVKVGERVVLDRVHGTIVDCSTCGPGHLLLDPDEMQPGTDIFEAHAEPLPKVLATPTPAEAPGLTVDQQLRAAALTAAAAFLTPEHAIAEEVIDLAAAWVPWLRDGVLPADDTRSQA